MAVRSSGRGAASGSQGELLEVLRELLQIAREGQFLGGAGKGVARSVQELFENLAPAVGHGTLPAKGLPSEPELVEFVKQIPFPQAASLLKTFSEELEKVKDMINQVRTAAASAGDAATAMARQIFQAGRYAAAELPQTMHLVAKFGKDANYFWGGLPKIVENFGAGLKERIKDLKDMRDLMESNAEFAKEMEKRGVTVSLVTQNIQALQRIQMAGFPKPSAQQVAAQIGAALAPVARGVAAATPAPIAGAISGGVGILQQAAQIPSLTGLGKTAGYIGLAFEVFDLLRSFAVGWNRMETEWKGYLASPRGRGYRAAGIPVGTEMEYKVAEWLGGGKEVTAPGLGVKVRIDESSMKAAMRAMQPVNYMFTQWGQVGSSGWVASYAQMAAETAALAAAIGMSADEIVRGTYRIARLTNEWDFEKARDHFAGLAGMAEDAHMGMNEFLNIVLSVGEQLRWYGVSVDQVATFTKEYSKEIQQGIVSVQRYSELLEGLGRTTSPEQTMGLAAKLMYAPGKVGETAREIVGELGGMTFQNLGALALLMRPQEVREMYRLNPERAREVLGGMSEEEAIRQSLRLQEAMMEMPEAYAGVFGYFPALLFSGFGWGAEAARYEGARRLKATRAAEVATQAIPLSGMEKYEQQVHADKVAMEAKEVEITSLHGAGLNVNLFNAKVNLGPGQVYTVGAGGRIMTPGATGAAPITEVKE